MSRSAFLPHIERLAGYTPGEQPREGGFIKLNTNENPYPPSPRVASAIAEALDGRLRLYPDPLATRFREAAARLHGVRPEMVLAGNGSDDLLTILARSFVGPGQTVLAPTPSYILYRTLADLQDARLTEVAYGPDWTLNTDTFAAADARLAFIANPNSPSGTVLPPSAIAEIAARLGCPLVLDEAYADFAETSGIGLLADHPNLIVLRTLSKGYGLAGLRIGYLIAHPDIVAGLVKVKDSYNCDTLSLLGGAAALEDQDYRNHTRERVIATRRRLATALRACGYTVPESYANFVWATGGRVPAATVYERLKQQKILVRLMRYAGWEDGLRVTVGTDEEVDRFLEALAQVV